MGAPQLAEVADRLERALNEAKYRRWSYSSVPNGFALVSQMEGAIKQKYANRHRAYQYIAESKRWESNDVNIRLTLFSLQKKRNFPEKAAIQ
jgi:hypothetical protein